MCLACGCERPSRETGTVDARNVGPSGRYRLRCVVEPPVATRTRTRRSGAKFRSKEIPSEPYPNGRSVAATGGGRLSADDVASPGRGRAPEVIGTCLPPPGSIGFTSSGLLASKISGHRSRCRISARAPIVLFQPGLSGVSGRGLSGIWVGDSCYDGSGRRREPR